MKALRFHNARDLRLDNIAAPGEPGPGQVVLKVLFCGICGTDLHEYLAGPILVPVKPHRFTGATAPLTLGHEFSGQVTAIGRDVTTVNVGDRVAVLPHLMKPGEYFARRNQGQFSSETGLVGLSWQWGGMGEAASVPEQNVVRLPHGVSDEQGAVLEPTAVAVNAIDKAGVYAGSSVLITGAGPIGALTALAARAAGATVYVYEPNPGRRERIKALGGIAVYGDVKELMSALARDSDSSVGADIAIECAGHEGALTLCVEATKRTGTIAQVGLFVGSPKVDMFKVCEKGLRLIGCWGNDITLGPRLVSMIARGLLPVEKIVTGRVRLEEAVARGFDALATKGNDHLKILIQVADRN
jgi:(R,R)-butanediol dehydrogenase / meso-butanediol dehydrogenase / diacetyl reductase